MSKGADYLFYWGLDPAQLRPDLEHIELVSASQAGPCLPGEIVEFMGVNDDAQAPQDEFNGVLKQAGFQTAGGTTRTVIFDNSIARKAELTLSKLTVVETGALQVTVDDTISVQNASGTALYIENSPTTSLTINKGLPNYSALFTGALNAADTFGNLNASGYSSCDLMVKIPGNACSSSGYLYVCFSEDGTVWYDTSSGVSISTSASDRYYWLNIPSFNMGHIAVTGRSPWGTGTLATTNSLIRICTKK